jgi:hypothetical protein
MQRFKSRKIVRRAARRTTQGTTQRTTRKYSGGGKSFAELFRTADRLIRESKAGVETKPMILALNELVRTPQFMAFCSENAVYPGSSGVLKKLNPTKFREMIGMKKGTYKDSDFMTKLEDCAGGLGSACRAVGMNVESAANYMMNEVGHTAKERELTFLKSDVHMKILRSVLKSRMMQFKNWVDRNAGRKFTMGHAAPSKRSPSPRRVHNSKLTARSPPRIHATNTIMAQDPIMTAMMKGELLWGDLLYNSPKSKSPRSKTQKSKTPSSNYVPINDVFENYETPRLSDKRFIWENFPVVLEHISTTNGTEKYAIKWHLKNLKEWRDTRTKSYEEAMEYQLFSELRLIHSLRKHPHLYVLHEPRTKDEIVVVEMIGAAKAPIDVEYDAVGAPRTKVARKEPEIPVLRKLNDITTYFPGVVVWGKVDGRKGESTYALSIRGDFMKKMDRKLANRILDDLEIALRASRFWTVLPPARGEYLRIEMRHE